MPPAKEDENTVPVAPVEEETETEEETEESAEGTDESDDEGSEGAGVAEEVGRVRSRNKYNNTRTEYSGRVFDSKREADRAIQLDLLKRGGEVKSWVAQVAYPIVYNGVKICTYYADFKVKWKDGTTTVEDVKGVKTAVYKLKKKLVKAHYGIDILET